MSEVKKEKKTKTTTKKKVDVEEEKKEPKKRTTKKETKKEEKTTEAIVKKEEKVTKKRTTKEKVKKQGGLLDKNDQNKYNKLCKVVKILAKIGRICLMIIIPFIILAMIFVPIVFNKFSIDGNIIKFEGASIVVRDDTISIKIGDNIQVFDSNVKEFEPIMNFINNNSKGTIISWFEISLLLSAVVIILDIYILSNIEKLFDNMEKNKTPFTKENTDTILMIAKYLLASKITIIVMSMFSIFSDEVGSIRIISLLIVFILYYVFKYGTNIQKDNDTTICD